VVEFGEWMLTPQRAAVHVPTGTLVIADLHLGYAQARRNKGEALPLWHVEEALAPLAAVVAGWPVSRLVVAGDFWEGAPDEGVFREFCDWAADARLELAGIVPGNHDGNWAGSGKVPVFADGVKLGRWLVLHGHGDMPREPVIHGHVHPCFRLGRGLSAPCFLLSEKRIVLPAFSEDAAGVNVLQEKSWGQYRALVCLPDKVLDFGTLNRMQAVV
jgi:putative SbcD/Mre11-related phosphoesterase